MPERANEEGAHPNRIREVREKRGITIGALAERTDVSSSQIYRLERGARELTLTWMRRLSAALECSVPELLLPEDLGPPFVAEAAPGPDQPFVFSKPSVPYDRPWPIPVWYMGAGYSPNRCVYFTMEFLDEINVDPARCVLIEVRDSSMAPGLPSGSVCLVDRRYTALVPDEIFAFLLPGNEPAIRRLEPAGDHWVLKADGKHYPRRLLDESILPLGLVLWTARMIFNPQTLDAA